MMVNVEALINSLGVTYEAMIAAELIPYKTKPTGDSGNPYLYLDMIREGVTLTFHKDSRKLIRINLVLLKLEKEDYKFPNELPSPLQQNMSRSQIREQLGQPKNSRPPYEIIGRYFGGVDHYIISVGEQRVSMLLCYNLEQIVAGVAFKLTELVQWKEIDPSLHL